MMHVSVDRLFLAVSGRAPVVRCLAQETLVRQVDTLSLDDAMRQKRLREHGVVRMPRNGKVNESALPLRRH